MYEDLIKRLRDSEHEIDCSLCDRDCCYPDGKVHGKCIIIEAADAIEAQDRHILTLQHEMMAEAESHIAEVNRLNKQIEELQADVRPVVRGHKVTHNRPIAGYWASGKLDGGWDGMEGRVWVEPIMDNPVDYCSECGKRLDDTFQNFCPNCGADMREER